MDVFFTWWQCQALPERHSSGVLQVNLLNISLCEITCMHLLLKAGEQDTIPNLHRFVLSKQWISSNVLHKLYWFISVSNKFITLTTNSNLLAHDVNAFLNTSCLHPLVLCSADDIRIIFLFSEVHRSVTG